MKLVAKPRSPVPIYYIFALSGAKMAMFSLATFRRASLSVAVLSALACSGAATDSQATSAPASAVDQKAAVAPGAFEIRGLKGLFWDGIPKYYEAVEWMPKHGMNWLMLCYTAYPESAREWRKDYTPEHIAEMRELVTRGNDRGVTICLSFNPGIWSDPPLEHSKEEDYQAAWRKVEAAHKIGIYWIALCLDDIRRELTPADKEKYGTLQAAQIAFTNRMWNDMQKLSPRPKLIFCPSAYTTVDMQAHPDYIQQIGKELAPEIEIFWTGPEVVSKHITAEDSAVVEKWLGRKPFVWDNYPVNDMFGGGDRPWRPLLAPLKNRSADLPGAVSGILFNPMKQWEANKLPLVAVANYLRDPRGYDPAKQPELMLAEYSGPAREAAELLMKHYGSSFWGDPTFPPAPAMDTPEQAKAAVADLNRVREILTAGTPEMKQLWEDVKESVEKDIAKAEQVKSE
jgi:hyaluronoglucosaminidase